MTLQCASSPLFPSCQSHTIRPLTKIYFLVTLTQIPISLNFFSTFYENTIIEFALTKIPLYIVDIYSWRVGTKTERGTSPQPTEQARCSTGTASSWGWRGFLPVTKRRTFQRSPLYYAPSCTVRTLRYTSPRVAPTKRTCRWPLIPCNSRMRSPHHHRRFLGFPFCP